MTVVAVLAPRLASIPSPPGNSVTTGLLELRAYGLAIAFGVLAAGWIAPRRWIARGGDPSTSAAATHGKQIR